MSDTTIEWTQKVWNPTTGCDRVSPGCDNCYALTMAKRLKGMEAGRIALGKLDLADAKYQTDGDPRTSGPGFGIAMHPRELETPFTWSTPRKVFVNSMSDLFHGGVSDEFLARVFAVMALTPQHTYQILTKRHGRMRSLLSDEGFRPWVEAFVEEMMGEGTARYTWPLSNVWLGVSVEDQKCADLRIPALLMTPAAVRFLSCEPLLGPVDLTKVAWTGGGGTHLDVVNGRHGAPDVWATSAKRVDWVIAGGESGHGARPVDREWLRSLRDQCRRASVPFHFKQWGAFAPRCNLALCGHRCSCDGTNPSHPVVMERVGKKAAGRELDGRTHDEFPERAA